MNMTSAIYSSLRNFCLYSCTFSLDFVYTAFLQQWTRSDAKICLENVQKNSHKSGQILIKIWVALTINMIKAATFISRYFLKDKKEFELEQLKFLSEYDQIFMWIFCTFSRQILASDLVHCCKKSRIYKI